MSSSMLPVSSEKQVQRILEAKNDDHGGVIVEMTNEPMDPGVFASLLRASLTHWRKEGKRGVWIKMPIDLVNLVEPAIKEGFYFHHAEPRYLMLVHWLPSGANTLPANATHRVGIGAFVLNEKNEVLVVQEKSGRFQGTGVWKFPTGVVDEGEDICDAAVREVKEETGIDSKFLEILAFRQSHKSFFEKSDLFFLCMMQPLSFDIQPQEAEIEAAQWMPYEEYTAQPFVQEHELLRYIADICQQKKEKGDEGYSGFSPVPTLTGFSDNKGYLYLNRIRFFCCVFCNKKDNVMGNANGREEGGSDGPSEVEDEVGAGGGAQVSMADQFGGHAGELMGQSPPPSPRSSQSPLMFRPQMPVVPLQKPDELQIPNPSWMQTSPVYEDMNNEHGIPTMITWSYGGKEVAVEGSWNDWKTREPLQRSGKDFTIMKVLPSGFYQYRFIVDGQCRYSPDLPCDQDESGDAYNTLDLQDYVPEDIDSISGFELPQSPDASYNNTRLGQEDFAKEPPMVPPHLNLTLLNAPSPQLEISPPYSRPQHVVLNHLYMHRDRSRPSVVALGSTTRFLSKYVTVVLYKSIQR